MKPVQIEHICNKPSKHKVITLCTYCGFPHERIHRCSMKGCKSFICTNCTTYINQKPFCVECILKIIKEKSLLIITKGDL